MPAESYLDLLYNHIDITRVPFSDRGSRLLVFQEAGHSRLKVRLAERLISLDPDIEAYLHRPAFLRDLRLLDEHGEPLVFEVISRPHALTFRTRLGNFRLVYQDRRTLLIGLPAQVTTGIGFLVSPQHWRTGPQGGFFRSVRNVNYNTNCEIVKNEIRPEDGGYQVEVILRAGDDSSLAISIFPEGGESSPAQSFSEAYAAAELRWTEWFQRVPPVDEPYRKTYAYAWWVMGNNLISPQGKVTFESMAPSKIQYVGLWLWDNAMHALAYRHVDADLARNQIRAMLAHQLPSGMLPDAVFDEGIVTTLGHPIVGEVTKPPILAWAALKLHEIDPCPDFLREIYSPLVLLNAWWFNMNDDDGDGLAQYNHPYSSGLDDSPLWDNGMPVEAPDLNTYLCIQMGSLALMAETLGMEEEGRMWRKRAAALVRRMIADFWDPQAGLFWFMHDDQPVRVVTPFNLYPLWTGQLPEEIKRRLIEHLKNPDEFWGPYVLPTVARNDPHYDPNTMWRGPVWANINYFFIEALELVGERELAEELRRRTLELIMRHASLFEFYNAETGQAPDKAADIFGWTAAVFIDLAIKASRKVDQPA